MTNFAEKGRIVGISAPRRQRAKLVLALLALMALPGTAWAAFGASDWVRTDQTEVRLIAAQSAVGEEEEIRLGLHFKLAPGWKVYWRSPGEAGFPPAIDWTGSGNLAAAEILWPAPRRFTVLGLDTMGYKDEVVFPINATLSRPGDAVDLNARVDYLTCNEICVPYQATLRLALGPGPGFGTPFTALIEKFSARVPGTEPDTGLTIDEASVVSANGRQVLAVTARAESPFVEPDLFVEFGRPDIVFSEDGLRAELTVPVSTIGSSQPDLAGTGIVLTLVDDGRALERTIADLPGVVVSDGAGALFYILLLAVLGGLVLNLMPCVLPVLSLKLLSVVKQGGRSARDVRIGFLASAAGIVFSFLVIAAGLIAVKMGGLAVGWGIQFQQPVFLVAMTLVLTLFAANLWGIFEIRLPSALATRLGAPGEETTLAGHFTTGMFATLLATPCSAPFLGTAVGFALSRGATEIGLVFLALGLGLALPYLAVAGFPKLAQALPRPGAWMVHIRRFLGLALAATAAWLISVLAAQTSWPVALIVAALMAAGTSVLWAVRRDRLSGPLAASALGVMALLAFLAPALLPASQATPARLAEARGAEWSAFSEDAIGALVREGKVVFVDVTADWCVTCKVNKKWVIDRDPVASELTGEGTVAMVADWTRPDESIADYLTSFGRYGIPFNAVYGPGAPRGVPLPELLTSEAVIAALERARAGG